MICPKCNKDYFYIVNMQNLYCYNCDTLWQEKAKKK